MEKINVAELLKDCPKGMELDCTMYEDVCFDYVDELNIIHCYIQRETHKTSLTFNQHGTPNSDIKSKCVIFPKSKTTWEGFHRPFKDGDIVATSNGLWIGITTGGESNSFIPTYCVIKHNGEFEAYLDKKQTWQFYRLATEKEKQKLFNAIKTNGYKWNAETKTLENLPKFKVGDRIRKEDNNSMVYTINGVYSSMYGVEERDFGISIEEQDEYELVPNKFDITNLKPYESRVLVRGDIYNFWKPAIFGFIKDKIFYLLGGAAYEQCIPYKNNEHLLGTKNDCDEYYKTWE